MARPAGLAPIRIGIRQLTHRRVEFLVLADDRRRTVGELRQDQPDHLRPGDALLIAQLVYAVAAGVIEGLEGIVAVYVKRGRDVALSGL